MANIYVDVLCQYGMFEKTSFDYAVVERAKSLAVVTYDSEWKNLGTWNTLTEVMEEKPIGDVVLSEDCQNTHEERKKGLGAVPVKI